MVSFVRFMELFREMDWKANDLYCLADGLTMRNVREQKTEACEKNRA